MRGVRGSEHLSLVGSYCLLSCHHDDVMMIAIIYCVLLTGNYILHMGKGLGEGVRIIYGVRVVCGVIRYSHMSTHIVPICQGFSHFLAFLHAFVLAKLATTGIRVNLFSSVVAKFILSIFSDKVFMKFFLEIFENENVDQNSSFTSFKNNFTVCALWPSEF